MYDNPTRLLTDIIYRELFGKTTLQLLLHLKLSPVLLQEQDDDTLRDHMGEQALQALGEVEGACADELDMLRRDQLTFERLENIMRFHATEIGAEYKAQCAGAGIDFLTGSVLQ